MYERKKLPVWAVAKRSYCYVWHNRRLLALPLGLVLAIEVVIGLAAAVLPMISVGQPIYLALWLPFTIVTLSFSVGLHRTVLLDEVREGTAFLRWDGYFRHYAKTCLIALLAGIALVAGFGAALLLPLGIGNALLLVSLHPMAAFGFLFLLFLGAYVLWLKVLLAFPAAAMGYRHVFSLSWRLTDGNLGRIFVILFLAYLPILLPGLLLVPGIPAGLLAMVWKIVYGVLGVLALTVPTVAKSLIFFFLFKTSDEFGED